MKSQRFHFVLFITVFVWRSAAERSRPGDLRLNEVLAGRKTQLSQSQFAFGSHNVDVLGSFDVDTGSGNKDTPRTSTHQASLAESFSPIISSVVSTSSAGPERTTTVPRSVLGDNPNVVGRGDREVNARGRDAELFNKRFDVVSWNLNIIDSNPFNSYSTGPPGFEDVYDRLMQSVSDILNPHASSDSSLASVVRVDVPVHTVFTDEMYEVLTSNLRKDVSFGAYSQDRLDSIWNQSLIGRLGVRHWSLKDFMLDHTLEEAGVVINANRATCELPTTTGSVFRPSVIGASVQPLLDVRRWWKQWTHFMFEDKRIIISFHPLTPGHVDERITVAQSLSVVNVVDGSALAKDLQLPLHSGKNETESLNKAFQLLSLAVYDAILVHIMSSVSVYFNFSRRLESMRASLVKDRVLKRSNRALAILVDMYDDTEVFLLQRVRESFKWSALKSRLGNNYHIVLPRVRNRTQTRANCFGSAIILSKVVFNINSITDFTEDVLRQLESDGSKFVVVEPSEIMAIKVVASDDAEYIFVSFSTSGRSMSVQKVLSAIGRVTSRTDLKSRPLIVGVDTGLRLASTTRRIVEKGHTEMIEYVKTFDPPLQSGFGNGFPMTSLHIHTFLQPRLSQAVPVQDSERLMLNFKEYPVATDHIFFDSLCFSARGDMHRDNTGERHYNDSGLIQSASFPFEHALLRLTLFEKDGGCIDRPDAKLGRGTIIGLRCATVSVLCLIIGSVAHFSAPTQKPLT
eukprot:TRINITY_DN6730_c2_g2_i2.p1 TRINITY_DN6730_c2_g2~~TRINITY_DN6730_c2_g2_i2.p1  ORF type:complete len:741 (-),score=82.69 TRINITY_DN6730_c2_g2_i2:141-2363(-)